MSATQLLFEFSKVLIDAHAFPKSADDAYPEDARRKNNNQKCDNWSHLFSTCALQAKWVLLLNRGARRITGSTSYTQHLFLGEVGQVSNPEQNESVKEAADPLKF